MSIKIIRDVLAADAGVAALVGGDDPRINPLVRPPDQGVPAITLTRISVSPVNALSGYGGAEESRIQVECWDATSAGATALAEASRHAIEAAGFLLVNESDNFDPSAQLSGLFCVTQEFSVWTN